LYLLWTSKQIAASIGLLTVVFTMD